MYKIYLSPSTQDKNIGANNYGTEENRMNQITDILQAILIKRGYEVFRNKPTMTLKEAVTDSNISKVDLHLAIHSNAMGGGSNGKARGCMVFCHRLQGVGYEFAKRLYIELSKITPSSDRGIVKGEDYYGEGKHLYETAYTTAPAALVEIAFHDNKDDAAWIIGNTTLIAESLAKAIYSVLPIPEIVSELEQALKIITGKIDTPYEYWLKQSIPANLQALLIKISKYIKEVSK
ncbi:MAG TPA: N-acetylmuramoyl-L-alanine amidase [Ruminiclostridium sp.]